jgi:N-acetylglucosamine kinase-like BadF-type ATPase
MYLGVDGGGTKTAFVLINDEGRILATHEGGTAYYLEVGLEQASAMLSQGVMTTLEKAAISTNAVRFAFFGLPAHGEDSALQPQLDMLPAHSLPNGRYLCGNDMVCSWAGSLACEDGISIVAGTGSIAYGEFNGRSARSGGWGEIFGDEGSAFWIAREGLALFSRMSDKRATVGPLYELVRQRFRLTHDLDLCAVINGTQGGTRSWVAQLARLVSEAATAGDLQAIAIFDCAAQELAKLAASVHKTLAVPRNTQLPVSYSGGVFNAEALVLTPFRDALAQQVPDCVLTKPTLTPALGAALYAARCCGEPLNSHALAYLVQSAQATVKVLILSVSYLSKNDAD